MTGSSVKNLVNFYDTPAEPGTSSASQDSSRDATHPSQASRYTSALSPSHPSPTPARFLHPSGRDCNDSKLENSPVPSSTAAVAHSTAVDVDALPDSTTDVADEWQPGVVHFREGSRNRRVKNWLLTRGASPESEEQYLLSTVSTKESLASILKDLDDSKGNDAATSSAATAVTGSNHTPVPAATVFARQAAPLALPDLDTYIASLPMPPFHYISQAAKRKAGDVPMFIPMDRLAASGRSIEDLETNSQVRPFWRNRNSIFSALIDVALGITGSSALATFYSLQGLFNTFQLFALVLNTLGSHDKASIKDDWRQVFLGKIPNILALNYASTLGESLILLVVFMAIATCLLYFFHRSTSPCLRYGRFEGFQQPDKKSADWSIVIVSFLLTIIYLPLSTLAVHVLTWSDDLWAIPNPYINATTNPPIVAPLGPPDEFRSPLDFCYTTTMKRNELNYAPVLVILAIVVIFGLTIWFPISLRRAIKQAVPLADRYTELGKRRGSSDMDREYQRLLDRDRNPLSFLYGGFRRNWATSQYLHLFAKLVALLIVAVIDPNNCLFRSFVQARIAAARQILLLISTTIFFAVQCIYTPFLDPVNNASEWVSRLSYILTSAVALAVALNIPGKNIFQGPVLYVIYIITYGLSFYFTIINWSFMQRLVKKSARRIDFSIDIFSPRLDISSTSPHARRRIWQEAITTLFLTSPECQIPKEQSMRFVQALNGEYPPYLLNFASSPGERHVENLKILRDVGSMSYKKSVTLLSGPDQEWCRSLFDEIQSHYVGPDSYWKDPSKPQVPGFMRSFGNAWWIPFPPTIVIRYDDGPLAVIQEVSDLRMYVAQNSDPNIRRRREIRLALRALDGQVVYWPHKYVSSAGSRSPWCCRGMRYRAQTTNHFQTCTLNLLRKGDLVWDGLQLGSGFDVELVYSKKVRHDGALIGLNDSYDLTPTLAQFLSVNHGLISIHLPEIESKLEHYRQHLEIECQSKIDVLTYRFLSTVYDQPRDPSGLAQSSIEFERDLRVRQLMVGSEAVFETTYERLQAVSTSEVATWWYIFWDDFWRRNNETISALKSHAADFDPHYPTSVAYTPLPRAGLETFLTQRGLLNSPRRWGDFIHHGFLNKLYVRLNDIAFHRTDHANILHLGLNASEVDMEDIDLETQARPSTLGTGGGTDHDDSSIRARPAFRWEGILNDPLLRGHKPRRRMLAKLGAWFGVSPVWRTGTPSPGIALDVKLQGDKYVLLDPSQGFVSAKRSMR